MITVTSQTLNDGPRNYIIQLTGVSDGSGQEDKVLKVDVSTLSPKANAVKITSISGHVEGAGVVELFWDALDPRKALELDGQIELDFCKSGGLVNNSGIGRTGDLLLSTVGFEQNSSYNLYIEMVKKS